MTRSQSELILTLLCASQVLHECLDELQDSSFYKHRLKQLAKQFEIELTKTCDPVIKDVLPQDEDVFNLIMDGIEKVSKQLATLDPAAIAKVSMLLTNTKS